MAVRVRYSLHVLVLPTPLGYYAFSPFLRKQESRTPVMEDDRPLLPVSTRTSFAGVVWRLGGVTCYYKHTPGNTRLAHWRQIIEILRPHTYLSQVLSYTSLLYWRRLMVSHNTFKKGDTMQQHAAHECDEHEHHGDEPGHVHDAHEYDDHDHHVDDHSHASHECDDHEHHTHAA